MRRAARGPKWQAKLTGLEMPRVSAAAFRLSNPDPLEGKGQEKAVAWFRNRGFAEGVDILAVKREVANNFKGSEPTAAEKLQVRMWMDAQERQGAKKGSLDTVTLWRPGRSGWMELKREGATISALTPEQEDMILWLHSVGFPVALAHACVEEMEEVYGIWGVPLRERFPIYARRAPAPEKRLRWPLEGERLVAAIADLRRQRAIRNTTKLLREGKPPPSENE